MSHNERKQLLWLSRNRAFRRLADAHSDEFAELRDEELILLGAAPIQRSASDLEEAAAVH